MSRHIMGSRLTPKLLITLCLMLCLSACGSEDNDSRIVISTGDGIIPLNDLQYQLPLVVQVADLNGSPQAKAVVTFSVKTVSFGKGAYAYTDTDGDGANDKWTPTTNITCTAEDINNNGILDAGEDNNLNGLLDPDTPTVTAHSTLAPTLIPGTSTLITDDNGFGYFTISYPKTEASWVTVQITATAEDGLPENKAKDSFSLAVALADLDPEDDPPAFVVSPYGRSASCNDTL